MTTAKKRAKPKTRRDVTRVIQILKRTHWVRTADGKIFRGLTFNQYMTAQEILTDIDARETKRDPHLRRAR